MYLLGIIITLSEVIIAFDLCFRHFTRYYLMWLWHTNIIKGVENNRCLYTILFSIGVHFLPNRGINKNLRNIWSQVRICLEHFLEQFSKLLWIKIRRLSIITFYYISDETLHRIRIEGVVKRHHLIKKAAKWPYIWFLIIGYAFA